MLRICLAIGFVSLPFAILLREYPPVKSFVLGLAIGLLNFEILRKSVQKAAMGGESSAARNAVKIFFIRYGIIALALIIIIQYGVGSIVAFAVGLLLPSAATALGGVALRRRAKSALSAADERRT